MPNREGDNRNPFVLISQEVGKLSGTQLAMLQDFGRLHDAVNRLDRELTDKLDNHRKLMDAQHRETLSLLRAHDDRVRSLERWRTGITYVIGFVAGAWGILMAWLGYNRNK